MNVLLIDEPAPAVRRLRINRPDARNAINAPVRAALLEELARAERDPAVRALLFASMGGTFCAGGDLPTMIGLSRDAADQRMRESHGLAAAIGTFPKPVVVGVEGFAIGAGAGLALLADHLILADNAVLGFPFMKIGLAPDWGISATLRQRTGHVLAARLLRTGANIAAAEALAHAIADEIVPAHDIEQVSIERASALAKLPSAAFSRLKARCRPADFLKVLDDEREAQVECLTGPEFAEGYAAMVGKRAPDFTVIRS